MTVLPFPAQFNRNLSNLPLLMTAKDVAPLLQLSVSGVYKLVRRGEIPVKRIGKEIRFPRDAFLAWLQEMDTPAAQ